MTELVSLTQIGEKPSCRLFRCRWQESEMQDLVRFRIDGIVQPVVVAVDADHILVDRELIRTYR